MSKILNQLVSEYISIDEYEPKSGLENEIIVVVVYATDLPPAMELGDFLEKSYLDIIDVEVSENPDTNGFYAIYIETEREPSFKSFLFKLISEIEVLSGEKDWSIKPYLSSDSFKLYDVGLFDYIQTDKDSYLSKTEFLQMKSKENEVVEFMENAANISRFKKSNNIITLFDSLTNISHDYIIVDIQTTNILENINMFSDNIKLQELKHYFGPEYSIIEHADGIAITNGKKYLLLK